MQKGGRELLVLTLFFSRLVFFLAAVVGLRQVLAKKYFQTKFIRIDAEGAPFFVEKLKIQVLPCVIMFKDGKAEDRIVGFDVLGGHDTFQTRRLENQFKAAGLLVTNNRRSGEEDYAHDDDAGGRGKSLEGKHAYTRSNNCNLYHLQLVTRTDARMIGRSSVRKGGRRSAGRTEESSSDDEED